MGYRLGIKTIDENDNIKEIYYGTILYGYCDELNLLSFKYLVVLNKIEEDTFFDYGAKNRFFLTYDEFMLFIYLYNEDLKKYQSVYFKEQSEDIFLKNFYNINVEDTYILEWR